MSNPIEVWNKVAKVGDTLATIGSDYKTQKAYRAFVDYTKTGGGGKFAGKQALPSKVNTEVPSFPVHCFICQYTDGSSIIAIM